MRTTSIVLLGLLFALPTHGQGSVSFTISDHTFNAGGHPDDDVALASSSFRVTLDAIGDAVVARDLRSASFLHGASFGTCYAPPAEVGDLVFMDHETLAWGPERSAGTYNLYRDRIGDPFLTGYGACLEQGLAEATTMEPENPLPGDGYFYIVTAENLLGEEGTKGWDSAGVERSDAEPCP